MKKEDKEKNAINKAEVKENKKKEKEESIKAKKTAKENIINEKEKYEKRIDTLKKDKKAAKDKEDKKEIKKEIKKLKKERNEIGKKDTYLRDVKKEMSMVRWPSAKEVFKYSFASLIFIVFFALFFFGIDALFALVKDLIG